MYQPPHNPPTTREWLIGIRSEIQVLALSFLISLQVMLDPFVPAWLFSQSLGEVSIESALIMGGLMLAGSALSALGLFVDRPNQTMSWTLEKAGWLLQGISWFLFALSIFTVFPASTISWTMSLFFSVFAFMRIITLREIEKNTHAKKKERAKIATGEVTTVD